MDVKRSHRKGMKGSQAGNRKATQAGPGTKKPNHRPHIGQLITDKPIIYTATHSPFPPIPGASKQDIVPDDLQLGQPTTITGIDSRGTISARFLENDVEVTSPLWTRDMGGDGAGNRDVYTLKLGWYVDNPGGGQSVKWKEVARLPPFGANPDLYPDPVEMSIPVQEFEDLEDDTLYFAVMVVETAAFDEISYIPHGFYLDRTYPGGELLPPLILPVRQITLEELNKDFGGIVIGDIAKYYKQEPGDILTFWAEPSGGGTPVELMKTVNRSTDDHTKPEFSETELEKLDPPGNWDIYYYLEDKHGNQNPYRSPLTGLRVWIKDSPVDLPAPIFPAADGDTNRVIRDPDLRPVLRVDIPTFTGVEAGMFVRLDIENLVFDGSVSFELGQIDAADVGEDIVMEAAIPYASLARYFETTPARDIIAYFKVTKGTLPLVPSDRTDATLDFTLPGGVDPEPEPDPDPDPDKPENPNDRLLPTRLVSDSGKENTVPIADNNRPATVTVKNVNKDGGRALVVNDIVQLYLAGQPYGVETTVTNAAVDLEIVVDPANGGLPSDPYKGPRWLYATITRQVSGTPVTAATPATSVVFQSADELPGGGTLATSYFIAGARKGAGRYAINGTDVVQDNGTDVRIYLDDDGVTVGMTVEWEFVGLLENGGPAPGGSAQGDFIVNNEDLRPRPDDPKEPGRNRAFRDIHISRAVMEAIGGFGNSTFIYSITVDAGTSTSALDTCYSDIRIP